MFVAFGGPHELGDGAEGVPQSGCGGQEGSWCCAWGPLGGPSRMLFLWVIRTPLLQAQEVREAFRLLPLLLLQQDPTELERCLAREETVEARRDTETPKDSPERPRGPPLFGCAAEGGGLEVLVA